jgi:hypothetical protein
MNVIDDELELATLRLLDGLLRDPSVRAVIDPIASRVEKTLNDSLIAPLAWEPVPLGIYRDRLPGFIRSSWVFVLRGNSASGAERHPNSHQRVMSYRGVGDLQIRVGGEWKSRVLTDGKHAPLLARWASISPNTWHQAVVTGSHWAVVSFHTVAHHELVEERPDSTDADLTHQRRYLVREVRQAR